MSGTQMIAAPSLASSATISLGPGLERRIDESAARREMRRQIARLERALGRIHSNAFPRREVTMRVGTAGAAPGRVLSLAELERVRDAMAAELARSGRVLDERHELEGQYRELITEMEANPAAHRWERVSNLDIGEPGCRHWHSRPRFGLLGALMGWWRVKVSSGCPLAGGDGRYSVPLIRNDSAS